MVPSQDVFYKRQLWLYSFCVNSAKTWKSYFYLYDEISGKKAPNEVVSCIHDFLKNTLTPRVKTLQLFCDNCSAQNKNHVFLQFCSALVYNGYVFQIVQCFPEPVHSFLSCDRSFGIVEKEKRKRGRLYVPNDYVNLIRGSSSKFVVKEFDRDSILDYKSALEKYFKKNVVGVGKKQFSISKYRLFFHSDEYPGTVKCSNNASGLCLEEFE